jgi:hypothetical protein
MQGQGKMEQEPIKKPEYENKRPFWQDSAFWAPTIFGLIMLLTQLLESIMPHIPQGAWYSIAIAVGTYVLKQAAVHVSRNMGAAKVEAAKQTAVATPTLNTDTLKQAIVGEIVSKLRPEGLASSHFYSNEATAEQEVGYVDHTPPGEPLESE